MPHELTDEELLESLKNAPKEDEQVISRVENDVITFLSAYNIKHGNHFVKKRLLYDLYRKWSKDPITTGSFSLEMGKYLRCHSAGPDAYFYINKYTLDISKEIEILILNHTVDRRKSIPWKTHFDKFLSHFNIQAGKYFVPIHALYDLYDEFLYTTKKKSKLGHNQFFNFCGLYFKKKRIGSNTVAWFGVTESIKQYLTDERMERLKEGHKRIYGKKDKNTKKRNEEPQS